MTATERKASIERILAAVKNVVSTVSQELQKGADAMDDEATHGAAIELLRGAPELAESLGQTVPGTNLHSDPAGGRDAARGDRPPRPRR